MRVNLACLCRSAMIVAVGLLGLSVSAGEKWKLKATAPGGAAAKGLSNNTWERLDDASIESTTVNAADDYYVLGATIYSGCNDNILFNGHSLTLGDIEKNQTGGLLHYYGIGIYGQKDMTLAGDGLILANGYWETEYGSEANPYRVYSKVTVLAPESKPFRIFRNYSSDSTLKIMGAFGGTGWVSVDAGPQTAKKYTLALLGGYDGFSGGIRLDSSGSDDTLKVARLVLTNGTATCAIKAAENCRVAATDSAVVATVGSLELGANATLEVLAKGTGATAATRVLTSSKFVATSSFLAVDNVKVEVTFDDSANGKFDDAFDLLTVPSTSTLDKTKFVFVPTDAKHPEANFSVRDDGTTKTLVLTYVGTGVDLLTQAEVGTNEKGLAGVKWSDGSTGTSADYNYATVGYDIFISSGADSLNLFSGNSLRIGDATSGTAGRLRQYGGKFAAGHQVTDFPNDGLVLACGAWMPRYGNPYVASGKVKVTAPAERPFRFYHDYGADAGGTSVCGSLTLLGPLSGAGSFTVEAGTADKASSTNFSVRLMGGAAAYTGTIAVTSQVSKTGYDCHAGLFVTNGTLPAVVSVGHGSYLVGPFAGETTTMKTLTLDGGSELIVNAGLVGTANKAGRIAVSDSFDVSGVVTVNVPLKNTYAAGGTLEILTIPAASAATVANFALATDAPTFYTGALALSFRADVGGETKTLVLEVPETLLVEHTGNDPSRSQMTTTVTSTSFTNANNWSDLEVPHEGAHYICKSRPNNDRTLRTPIAAIDYEFPGESLSLIGEKGFSAVLVLLYDSFAVPKMLTSGSASLLPKYSGGMVLKTELTAADGTLDIMSYAGGLFCHEGELKGAATVRAYGNGTGSGNPGGYVEFTGTNTAFSGVFEFYITPGAGAPSIDIDAWKRRMFETVYVSDGRNLGGAMSPANPKGVILRDCSMVMTRNSVTFDEPTRGWYVGSTGQVNVASADHELTFKSPWAFNGTLYKLGDGCLTLANPQPTFGAEGTATTPDAVDATKRTLVVTNGSVKIASAYAVNGLDVVMDNPVTKLVLDAETMDADLAAYGFVNILTPGAPLAVNTEAGVEKVCVQIACDDMPSWSTKTIGICTVKATDAKTVADLLDVKKTPGTRVRIARIVSDPVILGETSCVTFKAELHTPGLILLIK